ncbi:MAG: TetR/AcrR family transcriptional regulator [Candidatus Eremiobacteraeota bacterium]|nr:TetR/AcrR family transcriptional regulator [Candidatus Eremiobacteraeota bacterium]
MMVQAQEAVLEGVSTRERILRAARLVFERNGTRGTTTREVAERAGVNEATLFRHFGNKTTLLDAMREWSVDNASFSAALDGLGGDVRADLLKICTALYERMLRNQALIRISLAEEETDPEQVPSCLRGPNEIMQRLVPYLQSQIDAGVIGGNPRQLAAIMMGTMFALAMKSKRIDWGDEGHPQALIPAFVDAMLYGVKK